MATTLVPSLAAAGSSTSRMGLTQASCVIRWRLKKTTAGFTPLKNAIGLLDYCNDMDGGGVQAGVGRWADDFAGKVRDHRESRNLFLEGQVRLPKDASDLDRFEKDIKDAREAGADIVRTVCLGGRRYETFKTLKAWKEFKDWSWQAVEMAEPVMKRHRVKLAVENHKDWRIQEMLALLNHVSSEWIGVNLDTGNNISLLEDPHEVVDALAPHTLTVHIKDMGVRETGNGFLLAEVPLGTGFLDLKRIVSTIQKGNSKARFNLEMLTRDPLKVRCLTDAYWESSPGLDARMLARTLQLVRQNQGKTDLKPVSTLSKADALALEDRNNRQSFIYSSNELGLI